jgi:hypothetical protein
MKVIGQLSRGVLVLVVTEEKEVIIQIMCDHQNQKGLQPVTTSKRFMLCFHTFMYVGTFGKTFGDLTILWVPTCV